MGFDANKTNKKEISAILLKGLNNLRKEGRFCDITLTVGKRTIRAHKNVLSVYSPYFMTMFSGPFLETGQKNKSIEGIDADCLETLIEYMYTGTLNLDSKDVKNILLAASFFQITTAEELCCNLLLEKITIDNCIEYLLFGAKNLIKRLVDPAVELAAQNFHQIFSRNDYLETEYDEFKQLTQMLKGRGQPEDLFYVFVMRWINYSYESRMEYIEELLEFLDSSLISPDLLHSSEIIKISNPIFTAWRTCNKEASTKEINDHVLVSRRIGIFSPLRISLFSESKHRQIELLPVKISDGCYVCNGYYIYHQGGWKAKKKLLSDSYVYHPIEREWVPFVPLQEARAYHRSCVLNGTIYSVGGSNGMAAISSVEFINLYTGEGGFTQPLPIAKERAGLTVHENSIYVVGGSDRSKSYSCIHRMDVREGVWQELKPSPHKAGATSCAVLGESIYVTHPGVMQRYDIRADDWSMFNSLYNRNPQEVFALDDTLYGLFSDYVGRFIPEDCRWANQRTLKCNLPYLQVSANLRFPNVYEKDITDPVFEGIVSHSDDENADYSSEEDGDDFV